MSHPIVWMFDTMFYPLGNTIPTCLTQDLSPEQDADILLLGCGDPRNILYTLYADVTSKGKSSSRSLLLSQDSQTRTPEPRKLDITCCDMEPAVPARNALLFALIEEQEPTESLWDIFFHFKISKHAASRLTNVSDRLSQASLTVEDWRRSKWGSYIQAVDSQTLATLHRHWNSYANFSKLPTTRINELRREHSQLAKRFADMQGNNVGVGRSAGIFWTEAMTPMANLFKQYWDNGTTFTSPNDIKSATELNPTFVYSMSGEKFNPHYGTFPQGFHFAPAFAPISSDPAGSAESGDDGIIGVAKRQFMAWCHAFRTSRSANAIVVRFFSGEATALCRALEIYSKTGQSKTGIFTCQWRGSELDFGGLSMPLVFDVIDTSNLLDHLGALNVFTITRPLLKDHPASQSVLYTEALLPSGKDVTQSLHDRICADIPTIAMIFGLAPRAYLSAFTTQSNAHEIIVSSAFKNISQFHERVAWVDPASGDQSSACMLASFDALDLAQVLSGIYAKMLKDEQISQSLMLNPTAAAAREMSQPHYHRESFALLLRIVRNRVQIVKGDWDLMINKFLDVTKKELD